ncbi:MAG: ATP synthase subunit C [Kiritimatiellaceae bacterium]|nr:ATP synthase subunit C [Kiritimatiellaceae bacterium]
MNEPANRLRKNITSSIIGLLAIFSIASVMFCSTSYASSEVEDLNKPVAEVSESASKALPYGLIAASIAFGFGALGAGFAISHVGAAAMGAVAEKPEIAGQALIFVALAEGIVVFGFITALMILGKVG